MTQGGVTGRSSDTTAAPAPSRHAAASGTSVPALAIHGVCKRYGTIQALDGVSFAVAAGEVHALLGGNGSGKSTLIKALAGVVHADAGELVVDGGEPIALTGFTPRRARAAGLRFVHQEPPIFPELSIAENLALGSGFQTDKLGRIRWRHQARVAHTILTPFEIQIDPRRSASALSATGRALLSIARALDDPRQSGMSGTDHQSDTADAVAAHVLVLDEPTATLPRREVDRLMGAVRGLADSGIAVILVDHRLDEIIGHADTFTVLRDGRHVTTAPLAGHTADDLAALIVGDVAQPRTRSTRRRGDALAVTVEHLVAGAAKDVSLHVEPMEIVGLAGLAGAGASSTLRAIAGELPEAGGRVQLGDTPMSIGNIRQMRRSGVVYLPDQRSLIGFADMDLASNISGRRIAQFWRNGMLSRRAEHRAAEAVMQRYQVVAESSRVPLQSLSGGNQQKVLIAAALDLKPRVLLLDEPTQGVDVGARAAIHAIIRAAAAEGCCVLVASSDLAELAQLCDRVVVLRQGRVADQLTGGSLTEHALLASIQDSDVDTLADQERPGTPS